MNTIYEVKTAKGTQRKEWLFQQHTFFQALKKMIGYPKKATRHNSKTSFKMCRILKIDFEICSPSQESSVGLYSYQSFFYFFLHPLVPSPVNTFTTFLIANYLITLQPPTLNNTNANIQKVLLLYQQDIHFKTVVVTHSDILQLCILTLTPNSCWAFREHYQHFNFQIFLRFLRYGSSCLVSQSQSDATEKHKIHSTQKTFLC